MAFCSSCGAQMDDNAVFCLNCGAQKAAPAPAPAPAQAQAPVQPQAPVYQQPVYQQPQAPVYQQPQATVYQQPMYVKPKIPGRGFGISSLVLGIIGLVYGFIFMIDVIAMLDYYWFDFEYILEGMIVPLVIFSVLSILSVSFGAAGFNRGYRNGVCKSGLVLGIIGLCMYVLSVVLCLTA